MTWVPLAVHSQYSVLQSTVGVKSLVKKAQAQGLSHLALTDSGNLFGAVDFYKTCKGAGIHPIIGCQLYLSFGLHTQKSRINDRPNYASIIVLAKNAAGYRNLCKLSTTGYLEGFYYVPRVDKKTLLENSEGLICISGALGSYHGYFARHRPEADFLKECEDFKAVFKEDFVLQLQRMTMSDEDIQKDELQEESWLEQKYNQYVEDSRIAEEAVVAISQKLSVPLVATHEVFYLERDDWKAHEILLNVQSGEPCEVWQRDSQGNPLSRQKNPKRDVFASHEHYLKSPEQMQALFADHPEAVAFSHTLAERCVFEVDFKTKHYPSYVPPGKEHLVNQPQQLATEVGNYLTAECHRVLYERYTPAKLKAVANVYPGKDPKEILTQRLEMELEIIVSKGLADYLLIVADFIQWAKNQGIPVGPGRGSGAGSIVCYLLGITDIEPLRFHLFFERFINPERISYPDIDVDICMDRRSEVIEYMLRKYGRENVAQIITFGTMKAKMSLKDVGRVLNVPLSKVNHICKILPEDINLTLDEATEDAEVKQMIQEDEETARLFEVAKILEGCIRNTGIHAAGLIVCGDELVRHIPLCSSKDAEMPVTQYSMKPVESVGMLKIDFLGLKTLTSIQKAVEAIERNHQTKLNWFELPLDDKATFDLLNKGKTMGVFQLESGGMQDLARQLHLDKFEEIIAVVSLYRPGPMDMIPSFVARKHKREPIEYDHPWLEEILSETYGIMVYQEQVMQIASKLAGFTLAEGDVLRRAMGKKDAEEMARQRVKFQEGAAQKEIAPDLASAIFDKMEKFASYGFNKSHAAAYGYISYVTAYLKANYPREWMAALMTCDQHDISKVSKFIAEARGMDIAILPPDVNESIHEFRATSSGIRFALSAIKGLGTAVVDLIVSEREQKGPFKSLKDFLDRIDLKKMGRKGIELLIDAGAFDFTKWTRDQLQLALEPLYAEALRSQEESQKGFMSLFSLLDSEDAGNKEISPPQVKDPSTPLQMLLKEKQLLGFFLTGNPMESYQAALKMLATVPLSCVNDLSGNAVIRTAFVIDEVAIKVSQKTQRKFAILKISDGQERFELPLWSDLYEKYHDLLQENRLLAAVLLVEMQDSPKLSCKWLADLTQVNRMDGVACDEAYDKAKSQAAGPRRPQGSSSEPKKTAAAKSKMLEVVLDAACVGMSALLHFKKLVTDNPGQDNIKLVFRAFGKKEKTLQIGAMTVNVNADFEKAAKVLLKPLDWKLE